MPSDVFTHTTATTGSPAVVFASLQQSETWKGIGPIDEVWDATYQGEQLTGFRWSARAAGRDWEGTASRQSFVQDTSITLDLDSSEIAGAISVELTPNGTGTTLTVTLHARSKGFMASMFWGIVADALRSGLSTQVEGFARGF